jgi:uncharacterized membrane protein YeiH
MPAALVSPWFAAALDQGFWSWSPSLAWRCFDLGASFIWAVTGALRAARRGYDFTGLCAIALVSSTGGGLIRDTLLLREGPPTLLRTPVYIALAGAAALLIWTLGNRMQTLRTLGRAEAVVNAVGLGGFAVVGMHLSQQAGLSLPGVVLVGVVNAVGGSVLRSVLMQEPQEVFRPGELTALASLLGCLVHLTLTLAFAVDARVAAVVTIGFVTFLRVASTRYGWRTQPARGFRDAKTGE